MIPFLKPNPPSVDYWGRLLEISYRQSHFSNGGPCATLLEDRLAKYLSLDHAPVLVCNATIGLMVAMMALDVVDGDVIMPSFTFAATPLAALWCRNGLRLADIDSRTWSLSSKEALGAYSPRTKALLVVKPFGAPNDFQQYEEMAKTYGLKLIFDSAAALGAFYPSGIKAGRAGNCEVFSLHITKTFGVGEGGLITSHDKDFLDRCRQIINFGFDDLREVQMMGLNGKMSDFTAAIGLAVLSDFTYAVERRQALYWRYQQEILRLAPQVIFQAGSSKNHPCQVMPVLLPYAEDKIKVKAALKVKEIGFGDYYRPIHTHAYFKEMSRSVDLTVTEDVYSRVLCLPLFDTMKPDQVSTVVEALASAL